MWFWIALVFSWFLHLETSWEFAGRFYADSSEYTCSKRRLSSCWWISRRTYLQGKTLGLLIYGSVTPATSISLTSYVCFHFGVVVFDSSFFVYFLMLLGHILFSKISSDVVFLRKLKQKNHFKQLLISQGFLSTWLWLSCEPIQAFDTGSNQDRFRTNSLFGLAPENSFHNASHYSSLLTKKYAINIYF